MDRRALLVDAFTTRPLTGNPAGVVPDAGDLPAERMAAVAAELGASETAFVRPSSEADRRLRFFTPEAEVDLCGHAAVAAHAHLHDAGELAVGEHTVETNAGVHDVEVESDGTVWVETGPVPVREADVDRERVAAALGVEGHLGSELPLARAEAGLPYLLVPVDYLSSLRAAAPADDAVEAVCDDADADGVYAFTFDTLGADATLHGRAFLPAVGVPEDPVTGTASAAAAAYCRWSGAHDAEEVVCEQGHGLDRPGRVRVRFAPVAVGGRATTALDGTLSVPPAEDDDILEA